MACECADTPTRRHVCVLGYIIIMCILFTFLHILFKCCQHAGTMAHRLTTMTYFQKVYKCCWRAVMMAQTVMFFPLKDIAKLNTYCEADLIVICGTWMCQHANMRTCMPIRIYHHYVFGLAADVQMRWRGDHQNYIILQLFYVRIHNESSKEVFNMRLQYESSVGA